MSDLQIVDRPVNDEPPFDWRAHLPAHPATLDYPALTDPERKALADDIRDNGLRIPPVVWAATETGEPALLDGVHRLDALQSLGLLYATDDQIYLRTWTGTNWAELSGDKIRFKRIDGGDPYVHAASFNAHRRHLTGKQRQERIEALLKARPELSDRAIGRVVGADHKTVGGIRVKANGEIPHKPADREISGNSEIPNKTDRHEASGRKARGRKPAKTTAKPEQPKPKAGVSTKDTALAEFDGYICRLLQMIGKTKPARFAKTGVHGDELVRLGDFLAKVASARLTARR
jgi:hypothetical protein